MCVCEDGGRAGETGGGLVGVGWSADLEDSDHQSVTVAGGGETFISKQAIRVTKRRVAHSIPAGFTLRFLL